MKKTTAKYYKKLLLMALVFSGMFCCSFKTEAQKSPEWVVYNCSNMPQSICNYGINDFTIDKFNNKWMVLDCRLVKFDDIAFHVYEIPAIQYTSCYPFDINADTNGGIWFAYGYQSNIIINFQNYTFSQYGCYYYAICLGIDTKNRLWIYSTMWIPNQVKSIEIRRAEDYSYIGSSLVKGFFKNTKNGDTWMCIVDYIVQIKNDFYYYYDTTMLHMPNSGFLDACSDNNGIVWIANALGILKFENNVFTRYDTSNTNIITPVWSISCDLNNQIWLGTDGGLIKFDTLNCQIFNTNNSPLPYNKISKVMADNFGNIWLLCEEGVNTSFCVYREGGVILNTSQTEVSEQKIYIYPNPVISELKVNASIINGRENEIELYNVRGRIMQSQTTKEPEIVIDISHLPAGVYYCTVSNEKYRETVRVVKL